ncbi:MAG: transglycosylase SLT domain-containing protein [Deltaproteobacteria bacterium]|nr:transglycosylase SLT domain-containing protein [Deltaproteobacteria bacterium]MBW2530841.1 transglycosylase SLT domain-containing protein [Deltaproteobacteria bacterium]
MLEATPQIADGAAPTGARKAKQGPSKSAKRARPRTGSKAPTRRSRKPRRKPQPRAKGSQPGQPDEAARRLLTGQYDAQTPVESAELKAMRELDALLFPRNRRATGFRAGLAPATTAAPRVSLSGLPVPGASLAPTAEQPASDLSWLTVLALPDIPVRWEPAVVRYLEYYKNHPRGRRLVAAWIRKSGRYRDAVVKLLRHYQMPEDVYWLALVESAFNPEAYSWAGAAGLWQFMPATARIYGLTVNRRVDERLDPERSTHAALRHLKDLHQRFGAWELAFAAYNMGYGGLLASIRKYNTNDYWELRRLEAALPYETALYVPKIVAMAVVAKNCEVFGCADVKRDEPVPLAPVAVGPGTTLEAIAEAAGEKPEVIADLNPHLRGSRTPPLELSTAERKAWTVYVPADKADRVTRTLEQRHENARRWTTHRVRWGESVEQIARLYGTRVATIERINDLTQGQSPRPETVIFVPRRTGAPRPADGAERPAVVAVVPNHDFRHADRRRVFYQVIHGDRLTDVARITGTSTDQIARWNHLDDRAALQEGMLLQLFVPEGARWQDAVLLEEQEVHVLTAGTDAFFAHFEAKKGRRRLEVTIQPGDTWKKISKRYGLSLGMLERINHRSRRSELRPGETVVVYAPEVKAPPPETGATDPPPNGPPSPNPLSPLDTRPQRG